MTYDNLFAIGLTAASFIGSVWFMLYVNPKLFSERKAFKASKIVDDAYVLLVRYQSGSLIYSAILHLYILMTLNILVLVNFAAVIYRLYTTGAFYNDEYYWLRAAWYLVIDPVLIGVIYSSALRRFLRSILCGLNPQSYAATAIKDARALNPAVDVASIEAAASGPFTARLRT